MSNQITILVAEDFTPIRESFRWILEEAGHNVILAEDGEKAVNLAIANKPDLIILNYQMPRKDGLEAFLEIRKHPELEKTPILITSGAPWIFDEFKKYGTNKEDYMAYPFLIEEFWGKINALLKK